MFSEEHYTNMDFSNQVIEEMELSRKKFTHCRFIGADFSDVSICYHCEFDNCNFSSAILSSVHFKNCIFLNCRFRFANLFAVNFDGCKMIGSSLMDTDCSLVSITDGDWSYTEMRFLEFDKQMIERVNFTGSDFTGTSFILCILSECNFTDIITHNLSFRHSDIRTSHLGLDQNSLLSIDFQNTKVDLQQCILLAEAIGATYSP